jgi:hypothetical protein
MGTEYEKKKRMDEDKGMKRIKEWKKGDEG